MQKIKLKSRLESRVSSSPLHFPFAIEETGDERRRRSTDRSRGALSHVTIIKARRFSPSRLVATSDLRLFRVARVPDS